MKLLLRVLTTIHRWVGLAFCLIFVLWFASGIVMVYHRMPQYAAEERLARLAPLEAEDVELSPAQAYNAAGLTELPQRAYLLTFGSRPVYRFLGRRGWVAVFGDDGSPFAPIEPEDAVGVAGDLFPDHRDTARHVESITEPDQWTIGHPFRLTGPLHKISLGDAAATELYIARLTGEVALKTTRASRFWGYAGPVMHWFYFRPLRLQGQVWTNVIIYSSIAGCVVCLLGLVIGFSRVRFRRISPYAGWLRWHHSAGLVFGVVTFTFLFSGLLSVVPFNWSPGNAPDPSQVLLIRGSRVSLDQFGLFPRDAIRQFNEEFRPREIELRQFLGAPFYIAYAPPADPDAIDLPVTNYGGGASLRSLLVNGAGDLTQVGELFNAEELLDAARAVMPDFGVTEAAWLTDFDAYYYGRGTDRRLPVLRVTFNDPDETMLYLDAHDGQLVQTEVRRSRLERWLYHGLHSLDFPPVYQNLWLWYPLVLALSLGGLALSLTAVTVSVRYLVSLLVRSRSATGSA
jgi:hypothetical protein